MDKAYLVPCQLVKGLGCLLCSVTKFSAYLQGVCYSLAEHKLEKHFVNFLLS